MRIYINIVRGSEDKWFPVWCKGFLGAENRSDAVELRHEFRNRIIPGWEGWKNPRRFKTIRLEV